MLDEASIARAVDLSQRGYELIRWLGDGLGRGFIAIDAAHSYATLPEAARGWIEEHYENLPPNARPPRDDMPAFCNLFSTYLEGSFDLHESPGHRLRSHDDCFCPMCRWVESMPHLQPRKPSSKDKSRAEKMLRDAVRSLALAEGASLSDQAIEEICSEEDMREPVAVCAYAFDLFRRLQGQSVGPAQLVLWRKFAWKPEGSPKKKFRLTTKLIINAERLLRDRIRERTAGDFNSVAPI